ncbi:MAG: hypothetical protein Q8J76_03320, partial [Desulfobulbaceae bacterium]|nr:hypothetical protein [Desulfobulbaceae bacterium]
MTKNRVRTDRNIGLTLRWPVFLVGLLGCTAVLLGRYEPDHWNSPLSLGLAALILPCILLAAKRLPQKPGTGFSLEHGSLSLLVCALVWIFFRVGSGFAGQAVLLPALFSAWLVASLPFQLLLLPLSAIALMETGIWYGGFQNLTGLAGNLTACTVTALGLRFFVKSKTYRRRVRKELARAEKEEAGQECARDLGLIPTTSDLLTVLPEHDLLTDPEARGQSAAESIGEGFAAQLELVRQTMGVDT